MTRPQPWLGPLDFQIVESSRTVLVERVSPLVLRATQLLNHERMNRHNGQSIKGLYFQAYRFFHNFPKRYIC